LSSAAHPPPVEIAPGDPAQEKEVHPMSQLRRLAAQVLVVAVPVLPLVVETAGSRIP
jgi:hypothetical protein